jgi:hypothetical protein
VPRRRRGRSIAGVIAAMPRPAAAHAVRAPRAAAVINIRVDARAKSLTEVSDSADAVHARE